MRINEMKDAAMALSIFELWIDGQIDHNIAIPRLFNIPMLEEYQSKNYSAEFLDAFEEAVEYESIRSMMDKECVVRTQTKIINGFKKAILDCLCEE